MTLNTDVRDRRQTEIDHLAAAQSGDERAFEALTRPLMRELHIHCYRMLGSIDDADDALQDALIRAWRQIDRFEPRAPFRAWLYRIASNVCLTLLERRTRQSEMTAAIRVDQSREGDEMRLDPYPDQWLDELAPAIPGPEATIERAESIELAFVAAVQLLPPRQRATLLLRDVVGYSAAEVAEMLTTSVAGINSALQRGRARLEQEQRAARITRRHIPAGTETEQALVRRLIDAWHAVDVPAIVSLLTEDALLTMPPVPARYVGREAIGAFLATMPAGGQLDRFRLVPTRANHQPAVAVYLRDADGIYQAEAIVAIAVNGGAIASLVRLANPRLFADFGLPETVEANG